MEFKTPLYDQHVEAGGKIVSFGGYLLPVQYPAGVIKEHMAVRQACGIFDVSHMGEVIISGKDALANIQQLVCNDCSTMVDGRVHYSPVCNEKGGIVDDILVYKIDDYDYMLVVNAANRVKDVQWFKQHLFGEVEMRDISDSVAQIALQGPKAEEILRRLERADEIPGKYYSFVEYSKVEGITCLVSRTGYTGEDGFELYCAADKGAELWNILLEAGQSFGILPCGLGARDTLRMEAAMPLYGHEMTEDVTPFEAGLGRFVKLDKENFIGKEALKSLNMPQRKRVGLKVTGRGIVREQCQVYAGEKLIGVTTSGTHCPYVNVPIAMALVDIDFSKVGTQIEADVRGRRVAAEIVKLPFYKRS